MVYGLAYGILPFYIVRGLVYFSFVYFVYYGNWYCFHEVLPDIWLYFCWTLQEVGRAEAQGT